MVRKKQAKNPQVEDYRHEDAKCENIPPAGFVAQSLTLEVAKKTNDYNPNLPRY